MAMQLIPGQQMQYLNFEDPADMLRKKEEAIAALQRPAFESFIQKVVPAEMMSSVMALNSIRFSIGMIIGPAVAGIIATQLSPSIAYSIDLVTFAASLAAVFMIRVVASPENAERPSFASWTSYDQGPSADGVSMRMRKSA